MKEYFIGDYIKDKQGNIFFVVASFSTIDYLVERFRCLLVLDKSLIVTSYGIIKLSNEEYGIPSRKLHLYDAYSKFNKCIYCLLGEDFSQANKEESKELRSQISCLSEYHKKKLVEDIEELLSVIIKDNRKEEIYTTFLRKRNGMFVKYPPFQKTIVPLINEYLNPGKHIEIANL